MSDKTRFKVQDIAIGSPNMTTKVIVAGAARLYGVYINTALSAHAVTVQNVTASSPQVRTTIATIPASAAAGTMYNFPGIEADDSLVLLTNASGTGNVTVVYKPKYRQT